MLNHALIRRNLENTELDAIEKFFKSEKAGKITKADIKEDYINDVLKRVRLKKKFKVVVDFRHGTPGMYVPELLKRAGCEVISRRDNVDGSFPDGTPDPLRKKLISVWVLTATAIVLARLTKKAKFYGMMCWWRFSPKKF